MRVEFKRLITEKQAEKLHKTFLTKDHVKHLITQDADGYDLDGNLLFRFRKNVIPLEVLKLGVDSFRGSITNTDGRGSASGSSHKRVLKDGTVSNITIGNKVESGNVGYMDRSAMIRYCRKTAFAREYFNKFQAGIPFVQCVDNLYKELCPEHYRLQKQQADATNRNYVISDTSFTTVTVNRNFVTAVHKDSGDYQKGFGNLCAYRNGQYDGCYFCLPEFGAGIDMHNGDMLFVDVHRWHANTPFENAVDGFERISFVMYYREYMYECKQPSEELRNVQNSTGGFYKI